MVGCVNIVWSDDVHFKQLSLQMFGSADPPPPQFHLWGWGAREGVHQKKIFVFSFLISSLSYYPYPNILILGVTGA